MVIKKIIGKRNTHPPLPLHTHTHTKKGGATWGDTFFATFFEVETEFHSDFIFSYIFSHKIFASLLVFSVSVSQK